MRGALSSQQTEAKMLALTEFQDYLVEIGAFEFFAEWFYD